MWCSVAEAFSGAVVEAMHGQFDIVCGDEFESHLLREELANQTVHVLVGTALPRGIRMGKVEVRIERGGDALMLGELTPVVARQGVNAHRERFQHGNHGIRDSHRRLERNMRNQRVA